MNKQTLIRFLNRRVILNVLYHAVRLVPGQRQDRVILCYHSVGRMDNVYSVSPELFEKHIKKIKSYARFVTLDEVIGVTKSTGKGPAVSITFDDGYKDIFSLLPILKKYKIPATVFALSDPENADRVELDHKGELLSYNDLKKLHGMGVAIGCHSATHPDFHKLRSDKRGREITLAKKKMERKLGFSIKYFAYPKGKYTKQIVEEVKKAGFLAALTTNHENVTQYDNPYLIPRVVINGTYKASDFPVAISSSTFFIQRLHKFVAYNRVFLGIRDLLRTENMYQVEDYSDRTRKNVTVTIGTSVYNEENNIQKFLKSVLRQTGRHSKVKEILIVTDGCTDKTVEKIKKFSDKRIKLIVGGERLGKSARLNQLFRSFSTDVLVIMDADGYLTTKYTVDNLIRPLQYDNNVGLVAGKMEPVTPRTFIEKAVVTFYKAHYNASNFFDYNRSAYGCHGLLAYKRQFAKSLSIPENCLVDDAFSYFSCLAEGFSYRFVYDAVVAYRCPQTVRDYITQSLRYYAGGEQLFEYFAKKSILDGYSLPRDVLLRTFLFQLKSNVLGYFLLKLMQMYILYKTRVRTMKLDIHWSMVQSSKIL